MNFYNDLEIAAIGVEKESENRIVGRFKFDKHQVFFKGHFPGNPILPGVFQIEMIKFCIEKTFNENFQIQKAVKTKFASPILPDIQVRVEIGFNEEVENGCLNLKAVVRAGDIIAGRANLTLTRQAGVGE